jgi:hypothetical protein
MIHNVDTTRRHFLQTLASTASVGLADVPSLGGLAAFADEPPPVKIRFGPDIEPIVRLIEEKPRDKCVEVFIKQLRDGIPYRRLLAATFFARIRKEYSHHEVYTVHAVHQVSMDVRAEERLLLMFWAINGFKQRQEDFPAQSLTVLSAITSPSTTNTSANLPGSARN